MGACYYSLKCCELLTKLATCLSGRASLCKRRNKHICVESFVFVFASSFYEFHLPSTISPFIFI